MELPTSFWNRQTYFCAVMKTDGRGTRRRDVFSYTQRRRTRVGGRPSKGSDIRGIKLKFKQMNGLLWRDVRNEEAWRIRHVKSPDVLSGKQSTRPRIILLHSGGDSRSGGAPQFILSINNIASEKNKNWFRVWYFAILCCTGGIDGRKRHGGWGGRVRNSGWGVGRERGVVGSGVNTLVIQRGKNLKVPA